MNPILPPTAFVPDGEPHVFEFEGKQRLFLYGSRDERVTSYCGYGHDAWSAAPGDLNHWSCHGEIFNVKQAQALGYGIVDEQHFGAPDCVYNPVTRKYYLYTFFGACYQLDGEQGPKLNAPGTVPGFKTYGPKCVMAQSDSPAGPFMNPVMCDWPAMNSSGAFDPTALVDEQEDGTIRVYVFWGMKKGADRFAEVDPADMHTIIDPDSRKPNRNAWHKTLPTPDVIQGSTLFEANSIKKLAKDSYAFIYSANERISSLTYCYAKSPGGPWQYGGRIIDNDLNWRGGNNHGSIVKVNKQWFVFYHRQTSDNYNRQAMMEPIEVNRVRDRVEIPRVEMTSQGCDTRGLKAFRRYNIGVCCFTIGNAYIDGAQRCPDGLNPMVGIDQPGTILGVKYLNFGKGQITESDGCCLILNLQLLRDTTMHVQVSAPELSNDEAGKITLNVFQLQEYTSADGNYHEVTFPLSGLESNQMLNKQGGLKNKMAFFLRFEGPDGEMCRLKEFGFSKNFKPGL